MLRRVNPYKKIGLHYIYRRVRHTLSDGVYEDIDIVNCAPTILLQLSEELGISCESIRHYIKNRSEVIDEFNGLYGYEGKETCKMLINSIIFGGSYNTFLRNKNLDNRYNVIDNIENEVKKITSELIKINPGLYDIIKDRNKNLKRKDYNHEGSFLSYLIQDIENKILETIYLYCQERGIIKNNCVLCNDGIMILKEAYSDTLLEQFSEVVYDNLGIRVQYINKEFDEKYSMEEVMETQTDINREIEEFENFDEMDDFDYAEKFYSMYPDKYIYHPQTKWYYYNRYNVLNNCDENIDILYDISTDLPNYYENLFNLVDSESIYYDNYQKIKKKIVKRLKSIVFCRQIRSRLSSKYKNDDIINLIDMNHKIIAYRNGYVYDLEKDGIRILEREDYVMRTLRIDYEEEEDKEIQKEIIKFFRSIQETEEDSEYLLTILANGMFYNKFENIYFFTGHGSNGKGVLTTLLHGTFSNYSKYADYLFLTSKHSGSRPNPELAQCKNKRFVLVNEPGSEENKNNDEILLNVAFMKSITSNETISVRDMYKTPEEILADFTTIIQTNTLPKINSSDNAIHRRIVCINFPFIFKDANDITESNHRLIDTSLKEKFSSSLYHKEFIKILFRYIKFDNRPKKSLNIDKSTINYFEENNIVLQYFNEYLKVDKNERIERSKLLNHYVRETSQPKKSLVEFLKRKNIGIYRTHGKSYYLGITYNFIDDDEESEN